jgi:hypothetical protein
MRYITRPHPFLFERTTFLAILPDDSRSPKGFKRFENATYNLLTINGTYAAVTDRHVAKHTITFD